MAGEDIREDDAAGDAGRPLEVVSVSAAGGGAGVYAGDPTGVDT